LLKVVVIEAKVVEDFAGELVVGEDHQKFQDLVIQLKD